MRARLVALVIAGCLCGAGQAFAGAAILESATVAMLNQIHAELVADFDLELTPLLPRSVAQDAAHARCDEHEPKVHALLLAGRDIYRNTLEGPENDISLLRAAIDARSEGEATISTLQGDELSRGSLAAEFHRLEQDVRCGDKVFVHFGGQSFPGREMLKLLGRSLPDATAADVETSLDDRSAWLALDPEARRDLSSVLEHPFLIVLNKTPDGRMALVDGEPFFVGAALSSTKVRGTRAIAWRPCSRCPEQGRDCSSRRATTNPSPMEAGPDTPSSPEPCWTA